MAEWIEVPAHRIYATSARELRADFDYIGENGRPATPGEIPYRFVRKKDGKVFKWARFAPQYSDVHNWTALEEMSFLTFSFSRLRPHNGFYQFSKRVHIGPRSNMRMKPMKQAGLLPTPYSDLTSADTV